MCQLIRLLSAITILVAISGVLHAEHKPPVMNDMGLKLFVADDSIYLMIVNESSSDIILDPFISTLGAGGNLEFRFFRGPAECGACVPGFLGFSPTPSATSPVTLRPTQIHGKSFLTTQIAASHNLVEGCYSFFATLKPRRAYGESEAPKLMVSNVSRICIGGAKAG